MVEKFNSPLLNVSQFNIEKIKSFQNNYYIRFHFTKKSKISGDPKTQKVPPIIKKRY